MMMIYEVIAQTRHAACDFTHPVESITPPKNQRTNSYYKRWLPAICCNILDRGKIHGIFNKSQSKQLTWKCS